MIEDGSHYEAQQMLKTVYHRHKARKQIEEGHKVLAEGAAMQLGNGQVTCGVELGLMLVDVRLHADAGACRRGSVDDIPPFRQAFAANKEQPVREAHAALMAVLACFPSPPGGGKAEAHGGTGGPQQSQREAMLDEETRLVTAAAKWAHKYVVRRGRANTTFDSPVCGSMTERRCFPTPLSSHTLIIALVSLSQAEASGLCE